MKRLLLVLLGIFFISFYALADDYETPHRFKPGDVISADVLNEIFDYIESSKKTVTAADLVGQWKCTKYRAYWDTDNTRLPPGYKWSTDKLTISLDGLTFNVTANSSGGFRWNSPMRNLISSIPSADYGMKNGMYYDECPGSGIIESVNGDVAIYSNSCFSDGSPEHCILDFQRISKTRIKMVPFSNMVTRFTCDLQDPPPKSPEITSYTASGPAIAITWKSNSNDVTFFRILRKDDLNGTYSTIGTAGASTTGFFDVASQAGTYWDHYVELGKGGVETEGCQL